MGGLNQPRHLLRSDEWPQSRAKPEGNRMKVLWTLLKVALALALLIPVSIIVLATAVGVLGALVGLAFLTLRIAVVALIAYGVFRLFAWAFGGKKKPVPAESLRELPKVDPYYEASLRELDRELGTSR
jgi:hypothetical protein